MRVTSFRQGRLKQIRRGLRAPQRWGSNSGGCRPVARLSRCCGLSAALLLWACSKPTETTLRDSEGQQYRAVCPERGPCSIEQLAGSGTAGQLVLHSPGRIVGVCTLSTGSVVLASCRPLGCHSENECPGAHGLEHGVCIGGLCVEPSQGLVTADAVMLCLAGTGRPSNKPLQVQRYAMALNCGSPCKVPAPCRQPP
jgi:hypothetical protein